MSAPIVPALDPPLPATVEHPALTVAGIVVRTWNSADAPELARVITANVTHLRPWLPWVSDEPLSLAEREELIASWEAERSAGGGAVYGIWVTGDAGAARVVGGTGLHRRIPADGLEIGYWLAAPEQGRGIVTTVVRVLTGLAVLQPMITHVEIRTDAANVRSAAVAQRCGYERQRSVPRPVSSPGESGTTWVWVYQRPGVW